MLHGLSGSVGDAEEGYVVRVLRGRWFVAGYTSDPDQHTLLGSAATQANFSLVNRLVPSSTV
jgi:hypothetical protein